MLASDWNEIVQRLDAQAPILRALVLWGDGTLTQRQRSYVESIHIPSSVSTVAFTDSTVTRGLIKLRQWFGGSVAVYSKAELDTGLKSLGVSGNDIQCIRKTIREMERMIDWSLRSSERIVLKKSPVKAGS